MLKLHCGAFEITVANDSNYTFGSVDNARHYARETYLGVEGYISSQHAVIVIRDDEEVTSHLLAAEGGGTGINEHSALIYDNHLFVAVSSCLCALQIPSLDLIWKAKVDFGTCFGVHLPPQKDGLISHGELEISRVSFDGKIEWQSSGADIFTGDFQVFENCIEAEDWNGWRYRFDMKTGDSELLGANQ